MKAVVGLTLMTVLVLASAAGHARGAAPSSFVPKGPEPHSSLSDKHGTKGSSRKQSHRGNTTTHKHAPSHSPKAT
jgi:hypothetical protein